MKFYTSNNLINFFIHYSLPLLNQTLPVPLLRHGRFCCSKALRCKNPIVITVAMKLIYSSFTFDRFCCQLQCKCALYCFCIYKQEYAIWPNFLENGIVLLYLLHKISCSKKDSLVKTNFHSTAFQSLIQFVRNPSTSKIYSMMSHCFTLPPNRRWMKNFQNPNGRI